MSNFPESNKGYTLDETPLAEKPLGSANLAKAIAAMEAPTHLPSPCGEGQMGKINIELQKFFETLKGIKKYANVYVNGSINAIQNVTSLIRNTSTIIAGVMKVITKRIRDFIIQQIREAIDMVVDTIFPTQIKGLRNTIVQQIIDQIFCAFKDIVGSLKNLAGDFLFELIGKAANAPFCAAEQYTNALVNNLAANIDNAITPLLSGINDVLGGVTSVMGSVFEALDFILGFQSMTCMKPNCPEILQFKASPWGGPSQKQVDDFNKFIEPLNKLPSADDVIAGVDAYIGNLEIFNERIGDAPTDPNITRCVTDPFRCGPPTIDLFGGGGVGAVAEIVVDNIGTAIGANLISGGRGYTRPPFVTISDSCGNSYLNGYSNIDDDPSSPTFGQVTDIIFTTTPTVPGRDGSTETNPTGGTTGPNNTIDNTETPQDPDDPNNTGGVVDDPNNTGGVVDDPSQFGSDYVVCLEGFRVVSMGIGYTPNDIFEIDPDIPNLSVTIKLTEVGQVIDVQLAERICGLTTYPDVDINSDTGNGVIIEPILSFIKINDFEDDGDDGDDAGGVDDGVADDDGDGEFISINTDFVIQAEIAKNDIEGFITTLRGKKLITEKQQKEFTRRNVIQIVDCIT